MALTIFNDPFFRDFPDLDNPLSMMERAFGRQLAPSRATRGQAMQPMLMPHAFDVVEHKDKFELIADAPGMTPDEVKIELNEDVLNVSGSHEEAKYVESPPQGEEAPEGGRRVIRSERRSYQFSRAFTLPETANPDAITAGLDKGVLTVSIAKRPEPIKPEPKRIQVNASA